MRLEKGAGSHPVPLSFSSQICHSIFVERGEAPPQERQMQHQIQDFLQVNQFVFAGDSTFTLRSAKTGSRYTYKVQEADDGRCHFVKVLVGSDNENSYKYLGRFIGPDFIPDRHQRISWDAPSALAFLFFTKCLRAGKIHEMLEIYHEGKCGRCGRKLTTPESVMTGIGPDCAEHMGISQIQCDEPKAPKAKKGTKKAKPFLAQTKPLHEVFGIAP
jgi:hypothetical protein